MDWNKRSVEQLSKMVFAKHTEIRESKKTDRRNLSAIWNSYLGKYGASVVLNFGANGGKGDTVWTLKRLLDAINYHNESVADALVIPNPDRPGQFILIPRDMAERIIVLGLL
jgi:hypothetical protein